MKGKQIVARLKSAPLCEGLFVILVTGLAALLRLYALDGAPPGLYHDQAYNGLDALGVLGGDTPLFFTSNNGREPLFIYWTALLVRMLGATPGALRLASAIPGILTIPALYALGRELFDRRVAALAATLAVSTVWTLNLSRVAFRAVLFPPLAAVALLALWRGYRDRRAGLMVLAGALYGLLFYTYLAARFSVVGMGLYALLTLWREQKAFWWRGWLLWGGIALVVVAPLAWTLLSQPDALERAGQVAIWNPAINGGDLWGTLLRHLGRTLRAFIDRGDTIPRHNVPGRPIFGPLITAAFWLGLVGALWWRRRQPAVMLCLLWLGIMLLPTVLAEDAPHFLRASGCLPALFFVPAWGLDDLWRWLEARGWRGWAPALIGVVLLASGLADVTSYWRHWKGETAYYSFESGATQMAVDINRFLESGWRGKGLATPPDDVENEAVVWLDAQLWRDWPSVRYLIGERERTTLVPALQDEWPMVADDAPLMVVLWPYGQHDAALGHLPAGRLITVRQGADERGDLESEARGLYSVATCESPQGIATNVGARWEQRITLSGYEWVEDGAGWTVTLYWQCDRAVDQGYNVFCHLLADGRVVGQHDGPAAMGIYGTERWRGGDHIADVHRIKGESLIERPDTLAVGLYDWRTMEHLECLDAPKESDATRLLLPLE